MIGIPIWGIPFLFFIMPETASDSTEVVAHEDSPVEGAVPVSSPPAPESPSAVSVSSAGAPKKVTDADIIAAIEASDGTKTDVARKLGVHRNTVSRYIRENPVFAEAFERVLDARLDDAESALQALIRAGDLGAIIFFLKCQGKRRGYIEKQVIEHEGGLSVTSNSREHKIIEFKGLGASERVALAVTSLRALFELNSGMSGKEVKLLKE